MWIKCFWTTTWMLHNHWLACYVSRIMLKSYKTCWLQSRASTSLTQRIVHSLFKYQDRAPHNLLYGKKNNSPERKIWNEKKKPYCWFLFYVLRQRERKKTHNWTLKNMKKERLWSSVLLIGSERAQNSVVFFVFHVSLKGGVSCLILYVL